MNILRPERIEVYLRAKKAGCVPPVFCLEPTSGLTARAVVLPTLRMAFDKKAPAVAGALMAKDSNIIEPPSQRVTLSCVTGEAAGVKGERLGRKG